jgi:hypothetical protein
MIRGERNDNANMSGSSIVCCRFAAPFRCLVRLFASTQQNCQPAAGLAGCAARCSLPTGLLPTGIDDGVLAGDHGGQYSGMRGLAQCRV